MPQNMPGAGSVIAANYLANTAPQDGSVIGVLVPTIVLNQLFKQGNVQFDVSKLQWIGAPSNSPSVIAVWYQAPWTSWEAAKNQPLIIGAPSPTAPDALAAYLINNLLNAKLKVVLGYLGGKEIEAAMERGEVHARAGQSWAGWTSSNPDWVSENKVIPILQMGSHLSPDLPDTPWLLDLVVQPEAKQIAELYVNTMAMDRPMVVGPHVPPERMTILRAAYKQTMADSEFLADAKKAHMQISPVTGEELQDIVVRATSLPSSVIQRGAQILQRN